MTNIGDQLRALSAEIAPDRPAEQIMLESADEIERLTRQVDLFKNTLEATEQMVTHKDKEIERLRAENEVLRELSEVHSYD